MTTTDLIPFEIPAHFPTICVHGDDVREASVALFENNQPIDWMLCGTVNDVVETLKDWGCEVDCLVGGEITYSNDKGQVAILNPRYQDDFKTYVYNKL